MSDILGIHPLGNINGKQTVKGKSEGDSTAQSYEYPANILWEQSMVQDIVHCVTGLDRHTNKQINREFISKPFWADPQWFSTLFLTHTHTHRQTFLQEDILTFHSLINDGEIPLSGLSFTAPVSPVPCRSAMFQLNTTLSLTLKSAISQRWQSQNVCWEIGWCVASEQNPEKLKRLFMEVKSTCSSPTVENLET